MKKWLLGILALVILGAIGNWARDAMLQNQVDKYTQPSPAQQVMDIKNRGLDGSGH